MKTFSLTQEQEAKFENWRKEKKLSGTTIGGAYTFCFTPTGIGPVIEVLCADGSKLDLTDYDNF